MIDEGSRSKSSDPAVAQRNGIVAYGAYVPAHCLDLADIHSALGTGGGRGQRTVAGYDEDATTMAVEAGRVVLRQAPGAVLDVLVLATTAPPYTDKTNATAVHAALALDSSVAAYDANGAVRSTAGALRSALRSADTTLLVGSDLRTGRPGGADEANGGDGAATVLVGRGADVIAEIVGIGSASAEFLDRWRAPGEPASRLWEERFGETEYVPLADAAVTSALKAAGCSVEDIDTAVVVGTHHRAVRRVRASLQAATAVTDPEAGIGATGAAGLLLALAAALDEAGPDQLVLALSLTDGADAFVFRTTPALADRRPRVGVRALAAAGRTVSYPTYLTWRGALEREQPRRPEPDAPAGPPSARSVTWKFGLHGSRCVACDTRHLPPQRVCMHCGAIDQMATERLTDVDGTISTFTIDHLAPSLQPPVVAAVVDLDGGGRITCELTDVDPVAVAVGDRVTLTFRRLATSPSVGIHNYFWKAKPRPNEEGRS